MGISEGKEAVKQTKNFLDKIKPDLTITDVPEKTLKQFKQFAEEEFKPRQGTAHYGFALKWLMDFYLAAIGTGSERAEAKADFALERIEKWEQQSTEGRQEKAITTVDGKRKVIKNE